MATLAGDLAAGTTDSFASGTKINARDGSTVFLAPSGATAGPPVAVRVTWGRTHNVLNR